jgi:hypothetical protein
MKASQILEHVETAASRRPLPSKPRPRPDWPKTRSDIKVNDQNMIIVLSRYQTSTNYDVPLEDIKFSDIRPVYMISAHRADVIIIKDGSEFVILKHRHMNIVGAKYHQSDLTNIMFAR